MTYEASTADVDAIVNGEHGDPFAVLGPHQVRVAGEDEGAPLRDALVIRAFLPEARRVDIVNAEDGAAIASLARRHDGGFFEGLAADRTGFFAYRLRVQYPDATVEVEDPYRFPAVLGELDVYYIAEGTHVQSFEKMGAHPGSSEGVSGTSFCVWAPNAKRVSVVGDFNFWDGRRHPMRLRHGCGVWEIFLPGVEVGHRYKFELKAADGTVLPLKADPYAFQAELRPATASIVHGLPSIQWSDGQWMADRARRQSRDAPISIYEVHAGSWQRKGDEPEDWLSYSELADRLIPYVRDMGFTHIELMPMHEFPFDGSWGYQPVSLYAPTSRYGDPEDFQRFVDRAHAEGIGIILDWVPGHFPSDAHGLGQFDGTPLYEHADPREGFHRDWNTLIYNFGRQEVLTYLLGNALYWMERFHIDALRVDAVASMLYRDYSREHDEWVPNVHGGRENLEAIHLLKRMNEEVFGRHPGATTIAEESTAWPGVSRPVYLGGLGFGYKWNMGWMHDTLEYMKEDPIHRAYHHNEITFSLVYAFSENYVLPLSHDEVVHGKGSLMDRMPGDAWQKFANLRCYFSFMWTHPGKKLLFMGLEFGQWREWSHERSLDWHLLDENPGHSGVQALVRDLNRVYRTYPALHVLDSDPDGFEWIEGDDRANTALAFLRKGRAPAERLLVACNFTPIARYDYRLGVPETGSWRVILNSDSRVYGGSGVDATGDAEGRIAAEAKPGQGRSQSISITLPPLATVILSYEG
ncbi:1,4-alpha-glucan branching protein GlgB [Fodinicurvata sp. EGI_FJ10296]|uniref:1,4-alpha-glucan branching protein GlgB n=1 Tax=Fodinicurvata sp. EGI_FJ10296 TaxID=3231908 RepID=UPI003456528D